MPAMNAGGPVIAAPVPPVPAVIPNPSVGPTVVMDPFSGPKGSPFDAKKYPALPANPTLAQVVADPTNTSTGGLSTGIGFGLAANTPGQPQVYDPTKPASVNGFTDNYMPGVSTPSATTAVDSRYLAIGGGRSVVTPVKAGDWSNTISTPSPYNAQPLLGFGGGGSRDAGAGPVFVGFGMKTVTNPGPGDVAPAAPIEAGFVNRQAVPIKMGNSQFGSSTTSSPVIA